MTNYPAHRVGSLSTPWYLSGAMSGYADFNFPLFHRVAEAFRCQGMAILNPAELAPVDTTWETAMACDLAALRQACGVILLPGWEFSSGARLERSWARALGLPRLPVHVAWSLLCPDADFEMGSLLPTASAYGSPGGLWLFSGPMVPEQTGRVVV